MALLWQQGNQGNQGIDGCGDIDDLGSIYAFDQGSVKY
jgi:hypothetical protein